MRTLKPLDPLPEEKRTGLGAWIDEAKPTARKRPKTARSSSGYDKARAQVQELAKSGAWQDASPSHLVALYSLLHEQIYGVAPVELKDVWRGAVSAAKSMLEKEFTGDVSAFVDFIRWTWRRERAREDRRKAEGSEGSRIGWALQFRSRAMLTDYRVEMARMQEAAAKKGGKR